MLPVLAIVGQPNVGKSTLFNFLTKSRDALVADFPGLTRDRQYGHAEFAGQQFIVIDTGGIGVVEKEIEELMLSQAKLAITEANSILFMVDAKQGLTPADQKIAKQLRKYNKKIFLGVNKVDGLDENIALSDFYSLGFPDIVAVSATHGRGIHKLMQNVLDDFPKTEEIIENKDAGIKIAVIGRPNVGKSTLVNRMLGEERVIVFDEAGTTRDSIYIPFERHNEKFTLIDTAGVRRRGRVFEAIEKFSIIKTLQAIENANVVIFIIDASENVVDQDLHLLGYILETGRALVLAVNKWDGLSEEQKEKIKNELHRRMYFVNFARLHFISALHGTNVGHLFDSVKEAYDSAQVRISSHQATEFLQDAIEEFQPPLVGGRRIKLRYAHMGGQNPPVIVIHGNQTDAIPFSYKRYLINYYRERLHLIGTPIRFEFKSSANPFANKKEKLTVRQKHKKKINERTKRDLVIKARKKKNK